MKCCSWLVVGGLAVGSWAAFGDAVWTGTSGNWSDATWEGTKTGKVTLPAGAEITVSTQAELDEVNALTELNFAGPGVQEGTEEPIAAAKVTFTTANPFTCVLTGTGTICKTSDYDWDLVTRQDNWYGDMVFSGNALIESSNVGTYAFGAVDLPKAGSVTFKDGTTHVFTLTGKTNTKRTFNYMKLHVAGRGKNGMGLFDVDASWGDGFSFLELDDDAYINIKTCSLNLSNTGSSNGVVRLNGHTLTVGTARMYCEGKSQVYGPGTLCLTNGVTWWIGNGHYMGDENVTVEVASGLIDFHDKAPVQKPFKLVMPPHSTKANIQTSGFLGFPTNNNVLTGPIFLPANEKGKTFSLNPYVASGKNPSNFFTVAGPFIGAGNLYQSKRGRVVLACPTNDAAAFTGSLGIADFNENGTHLTLMFPNSFPNYSKISVGTRNGTDNKSNGGGRITVPAENWTLQQAADLINQVEMRPYANVTVTMDPTGLPDQSLELNGADIDAVHTTDQFGLGMEGVGQMTITGPVRKPLRLSNYLGTLKLTGSETINISNGWFAADFGEQTHQLFLLEDAADVVTDTNSALKVGGAMGTSSVSNSFGRMKIVNSTLRPAGIAPVAPKEAAALCIGNYNSPGILEIGEGACVTQLVKVGTDSRGPGAVYQTAGDFVCETSKSSENGACCCVGETGYGCWMMTGGTFKSPGYFRLANWRPASQGIFFQNGGTASVYQPPNGNAYFNIGSQAGRGMLYVTNGSFSCSITFYNAISYASDRTNETAYGCVTATGGGRIKADTINMAHGPHRKTTANANEGGTLSLQNVCMTSTATEDVQTDVNLNGGTIEGRLTTEKFWGFSEATDVKHVTIYEKGGTFSVLPDVTVTLQRVPMAAPTGLGVVSIALPGAWAHPAFIGPLVVEIVDDAGTGHGAAAIAHFDVATKQLTGIEVISHGCDYTAGSTRAIMRYGIYNVECPVTLGTITGGGLTKAGAGTLVLNVANTYAGGTTLQEGTLKFNVADAIPQNHPITLNGGTLDLNGFGYTASGLSGTGATVVGGTLKVTGNQTIAAADVIAGKTTQVTGDLDLTGLVLTVDDPAALNTDAAHFLGRRTLIEATSITGTPTLGDADLIPGWSLVTSSTRVRFGYAKGTVIIVR